MNRSFIRLKNSSEDDGVLKSEHIESESSVIESKRFTRRKESLVESKGSKVIKLNNSANEKCDGSVKNGNLSAKGAINPAFIKTEELLLKIEHSAEKYKRKLPHSSTERTPRKTSYLQLNDTLEKRFNLATQLKGKSEKDNLQNLQAQIDIKSNEIIILQDENLRLKTEIHQRMKENTLEKQFFEKEHQKSTQENKLIIFNLKADLQSKDQQLQSQLQQNQILRSENKRLDREKSIIEKQIQQLYNKKISKQSRDLMSFRQISLKNQVDELKIKLEESKTILHEELEKQIQNLHSQSAIRINQCKNLEIANRVLNKKAENIEMQCKDANDTFKRKYSILKFNYNELQNQVKEVKIENKKLKRESIMTKEGKSKRKGSSEESVSFSLSNSR